MPTRLRSDDSAALLRARDERPVAPQHDAEDERERQDREQHLRVSRVS